MDFAKKYFLIYVLNKHAVSMTIDDSQELMWIRNHLERLLNSFRVHSVDLQWGLRVCIADRSPGQADAANLGTTHTF